VSLHHDVRVIANDTLVARCDALVKVVGHERGAPRQACHRAGQ
jgi:hypothetical protein